MGAIIKIMADHASKPKPSLDFGRMLVFERCDVWLKRVIAPFFLGLCALSIASPILAQGMFQAEGPIAEHQRIHFLQIFWTAMIAVLPVLIGVPILLFRYRRGRGHKYDPEFEFSKALEYPMWGVPIAITIILSIWLWRANEDLDPYKQISENPLKIQAIGLNWKWLFIYPEQNIASIGTLAIPQNQDVEISLTADTVMLSFMVPQLAGQIYAMPGMITKINLQADQAANLKGANYQYNGDGFSYEQITVEAMSDENWQSWISQAQSAPLLNQESYQLIAKPSQIDETLEALNLGSPQMSLGEVNLFNQIVMRYHSGEAISADQQAGAPGYKEDDGS